MRKLSIFVDESGDFGLRDRHSPYYIVIMVLHDEAHDLTKTTERLDFALAQLGYENQAVHTEPLIRREDPY